MRNAGISMLVNEMLLLRANPRKEVLERIKKNNLERLEHMGILRKFVDENNGCWDHQKWIDLCEEISFNEFEPIDFNKIGLLLEEEKSRYFTFES